MESGVEEYPSRGNCPEQPGTVHTTFEPDSVGHTPSIRSARNPRLFRAVAKDPEHRVGVSDVSQRANRQLPPFPGEQARCEHDIFAPGTRWLYVADVDGCRVRHDTHTAVVYAYEPGSVLVLGENHGRSLLRQACGPDAYKKAARKDADSLIEQALPAELADETGRRFDTATYRSPHKWFVDDGHTGSRPVRRQRDMVNNIKINAPIQRQSPRRGLTLPSVVIPVKARSGQLEVKRLIDVEVDSFQVDPGSPAV